MNKKEPVKLIVCEMVKDWMDPYAKQGEYIPKVLFSNHHRFISGTRLDWGFVRTALHDGYDILIKSTEEDS